MEEPTYNLEYSSVLFAGENYQKKVGEVGMIQIDMPMPEHCGDCPCCSDVFTSDGEQMAQWCRLLGKSTDYYASPYDNCPLKEQGEKKREMK